MNIHLNIPFEFIQAFLLILYGVGIGIAINWMGDSKWKWIVAPFWPLAALYLLVIFILFRPDLNG
jgi:hypothetical protein